MRGVASAHDTSKFISILTWTLLISAAASRISPGSSACETGPRLSDSTTNTSILGNQKNKEGRCPFCCLRYVHIGKCAGSSFEKYVAKSQVPDAITNHYWAPFFELHNLLRPSCLFGTALRHPGTKARYLLSIFLPSTEFCLSCKFLSAAFRVQLPLL